MSGQNILNRVAGSTFQTSLKAPPIVLNLWLCLLLPFLTDTSAICTVVTDALFIAVTLQEGEARKQPHTVPWCLCVPFCGKVSPEFTPIKAGGQHNRRGRNLLLSGVSSSLPAQNAVLHIVLQSQQASTLYRCWVSYYGFLTKYKGLMWRRGTLLSDQVSESDPFSDFHKIRYRNSLQNVIQKAQEFRENRLNTSRTSPRGVLHTFLRRMGWNSAQKIFTWYLKVPVCCEGQCSAILHKRFSRGTLEYLCVVKVSAVKYCTKGFHVVP